MVATRRMTHAATRIQNFMRVRQMMRQARMQGLAFRQMASMQRMQNHTNNIASFIKQYRPNDQIKKRHRLPDEQPKTQRVVSYRRRV